MMLFLRFFPAALPRNVFIVNGKGFTIKMKRVTDKLFSRIYI